jgi:predicted kinase
MTALCYSNALRELGGARRIVEDEVRTRLRDYGTKRRRADPPDAPFADRRLREESSIIELTSRVSRLYAGF